MADTPEAKPSTETQPAEKPPASIPPAATAPPTEANPSAAPAPAASSEKPKTETSPSPDKVEKPKKPKLAVVQEIKDVFKSVSSADRPTRRMAVWFIFNLICFMIVLIILFERHITATRAVKLEIARQQAAQAEAEKNKVQEKERYHSNTIVLGTFTIQLRSDLNLGRDEHVYNLAEIEVVALCWNQETKLFLQENAVPARDEVASVFTPMDRDELMSRKGKVKLKTRILKKINDWLTDGKVEDVYISKLIIT